MTHNRLAESNAVQSADDGLTVVVENLKIRTIDPPVLAGGTLVPLSQLDPEYAAHRAAYLKSRSGGLIMRVRKPP